MADQNRIPDPSLSRLAGIYRVLLDAAADGVTHLNSLQLQDLSGIGAAQIRKDLSHIGVLGRSGVGYEVSTLLTHVADKLNLSRTQRFALVGAGRLGQALAAYPGVSEYSFELAAAFDSDPQKVGTPINGTVIEHVSELAKILAKRGIRIVVIAVPASAAQSIVDVAVSGGARWFLNFSPAHVQVPEDCMVRNVSFTHEFAVLAHYLEN
ncbi:MAG: redox-sensing transcriptional repressor Rex [Fimbriimonadales bacterium]